MKLSKSIKKGVLVVVSSGASKGMKGKVLEYLRSKDLVIVEGVNLRKTFVKKSQARQEGSSDATLTKEIPIHISNLRLDRE